MTIFFSFFFFLNRPKQLIELRRNPQGTIEKRGVRSTVKPQLPGKYGGGGGSGGKQNKGASQNRESSLHHKSKTRNAKLRKELRNLDDQIQVKQQTQFSFLFFSFFFDGRICCRSRAELRLCWLVLQAFGRPLNGRTKRPKGKYLKYIKGITAQL